MRNILVQFTGIAMASLLLSTQASATKLYMKNDNDGRVDIIIERSMGNAASGAPAIKQVLEAGEEMTLTINKEALDSAGAFVIRGIVPTLSPYSICGPLSVYQDYKIIFVGGGQGSVVCTYEEVAK